MDRRPSVASGNCIARSMKGVHDGHQEERWRFVRPQVVVCQHAQAGTHKTQQVVKQFRESQDDEGFTVWCQYAPSAVRDPSGRGACSATRRSCCGC
jgi:hypothetical protein